MGNCACGGRHSELVGSGRLLVTIEITPVCNNACPGCGNVFADARSPQPLSAQAWHAVLDKIASTIGYLEITGGEPTLHPGFFAILEHVGTLGVPFTIFTNGRWPDPARLLDVLQRMDMFDNLLISLHGAQPATHEAFSGVAGSFDEAVENIQRATAAGLRVTSSTVLTRPSCGEIDAIVAKARRLGASGFAFQRFIGTPPAELAPDREELRRAVVKIDELAGATGDQVRFGTPIPQCFVPNRSEICLAGIAQVTVDPWGNVRPCNHSSRVCGNLQKDSIPEILNSAAMQTFCAAIPEACRTCPHFEACQGGCRAMITDLGLAGDPLMCRAAYANY